MFTIFELPENKGFMAVRAVCEFYVERTKNIFSSADTVDCERKYTNYAINSIGEDRFIELDSLNLADIPEEFIYPRVETARKAINYWVNKRTKITYRLAA